MFTAALKKSDFNAGGIMETSVILEVRYAETDMMGIMHHSRYYPWFEVARTEFIKNAGITYSELEKSGILLPLTETGAKYYEGLKYEEKAEVICRLKELSVARCGFFYTVRRVSDGHITTEGFTRHGFVDPSFHPINIKKKNPGLFDSLMSLKEE